MKRYVTDTQCLLWFIAKDRRLPRAAKKLFDQAKQDEAQILVPAIVLVEGLFLLKRQRVKESVVVELMTLSDDPSESIYVIPLDLQVVRTMREFGPTAVTELADQVIAATARAFDLPLITTDEEIIESGLVQTIQ